MIKTNINLDLIKEYEPSTRIIGGNVKKFDWNECNLPYDEEYLKKLTSSLSSINYSEYPNINNKNLYNKLSSYCDVSPENIQLFNGSDSALHYIFASFLNKDTNVLIYYPNYSQIETYVRLYSYNINYSEINDLFGEHNYGFRDIEKNDVIYISNPNNPTGFCIHPDVIENLLIKYQNKLFIIDEAYYEFCDKTCSKLTNSYNNIIVTRTFSKAFSLASIRLGYVCASEELIKSINKIRNTKEVNSFAQKLGEIAIDNFEHIKNRINIIKNNREKLQKVLNENKIKFIKSEANFILIKVKNSKKIVEDLYDLRILVRDRSMFTGLENTIRVTIGEWSDMEIIINAILNQYEYT